MKKGLLTLAIIITTCCTSKTNSTNTDIVIEKPIATVDNFLVNKVWLCQPTDNDLIFVPIDTTRRYSYGFHIHFVDSTNYVNYYTAPCGNDCFTSIYGKYKLLTDSTVSLTRDSITYRGECRMQPTEYPNTKTEYVMSSKEDGGFTLKKVVSR